MHKLCKKEQKKRFLAIFSSLGPRIDLILHMMVVLNVSHRVAVVLGHVQLIKYA